MKQFISIFKKLLCICFPFCIFSCSQLSTCTTDTFTSRSVTINKIKTFTDNSGFTYYVNNINPSDTIIETYTGATNEMQIPATTQNDNITYTVTAIGNNAFYECPSLTSVTIPDSITSIGTEAFKKCPNLTSVNIPDTVVYIGESAFEGCKNLTSIKIPSSLSSIEDFTFNNCTSLSSVTISNSVTAIGDFAFLGCTSLTSIIVPDSITSIGSWAFDYCISLTSVTIPESVTFIGQKAFDGCSKLTSVIFDDTLNWYITTKKSKYSSANSIFLSNTNTNLNAKYLRSTYNLYHWYKK